MTTNELRRSSRRHQDKLVSPPTIILSPFFRTLFPLISHLYFLALIAANDCHQRAGEWQIKPWADDQHWWISCWASALENPEVERTENKMLAVLTQRCCLKYHPLKSWRKEKLVQLGHGEKIQGTWLWRSWLKSWLTCFLFFLDQEYNFLMLQLNRTVHRSSYTCTHDQEIQTVWTCKFDAMNMQMTFSYICTLELDIFSSCRPR